MTEPKDVIRQIKKATRREFSADDKVRIVLEGLRGETAISELCRLKVSRQASTTNGLRPFRPELSVDFWPLMQKNLQKMSPAVAFLMYIWYSNEIESWCVSNWL